ncbi:ParA family protein [Rickettsiales endosymbiont of Stachyamoeba lipophora]|uniref:ParA family protein n=1 Tax=Rickettsiales endosymbiont of Stachyamoeba lipophora TaxID=2486578 RepID=UPI000F6527C8|nr:AAA family ATPase [Rickettsiales endosymbiont of Stachyamoeba lipophora]AZL15632.1 ParA family protein [Rickettsiales endosymbiont of Stachyamoeba lipophora]
MHQKIIAIVNQKGGVGKTTTAINVATAFAATRKKVLLIDLDPQGNASTGVGVEISNREKTIYEVLIDEVNIQDAIITTFIPGLDIISSTVDLSATEIELINIPKREYVLQSKIAEISNNYDFIIIDCPPSLGMLTINALTAAKGVVIPLQCEFFALEGLAHLLKSINLIQQKLNPELQIIGVLLTMYDRRNRLTEAVEQDVRGCLGDLVFQTAIPRNVKLTEAPSHGKPAIIYDHKCSGSQAYAYLVKEMYNKFKNDRNDNSVKNKRVAI